MDRYEPWLQAMYFYCSSELYDLDRLKADVVNNQGKRDFIQSQLKQILTERPFTASDWEKRMNLEHQNDDDLYEFLNALYQFLFEGGAYPEWD